MPGRLLISLYPLHLEKWLRYFPCSQLLLLRSNGLWSSEALRHTARFLGVGESSAELAAAAGAVRPEQDVFKREAAGLGSKVPKQDMLDETRKALQAFFEAHWDARFPEVSAFVETAFSYILPVFFIHISVSFICAAGNKPTGAMQGSL